MSDGVPVGELRCPTCRELFPVPLQVKMSVRTSADTGFEMVVVTEGTAPRSVMPWRAPYVICPNDHWWTIKRLWRYVPLYSAPDDVLLGELMQ